MTTPPDDNADFDTQTQDLPPPLPGVSSGTFLCRACSYDLAGLPLDALCPECGSPISDSLRSDALINSSPVWLTTISRGATILFWATFAHFAILIAGRPLIGILANMLTTHPFPTRFIVSLFNLLLSCLIIFGSWRLTSPEHAIVKDNSRRIALSARILMISALGIALFSYSATLTGNLPSLFAVSFVLYCLYTIAWGLTLLYAAFLFVRMGQHQRANNARIVAWGLIITGIFLFASIGILAISAPGGLMVTAVPVMCGAMILMALFIVAAMICLAQLMTSLNIVTTYARRLHAADLEQH